MSIEIIPTGAALGAEIRGVDLLVAKEDYTVIVISALDRGEAGIVKQVGQI